jgi:diacylglycerol kinase family enzyme
MAKKEHDDIVLICNPSAGGRWKQLAGILDSAEAQRVRRVVTDSIDDIGPALSSLSKRVKLVCVYGGDGTIQKILNEIFRTLGDGQQPPVALVGGGTMNVTSRWCGWTGSPERNFRRVVQHYLTDKLVTREVPLLDVRQGERRELGFTFGVGTVIRILHEYEKGKKSKLGALILAAKSVTAAWGKFPADYLPVLEQMVAEVKLDGETLPYNRFAGAFCNITGNVVRLVAPFQQERERETFYVLAYAINARELGTLLPLIIRGFIPIDPKTLIKPVSSLTHVGLTYFGKGSLPLDPRYINRTASLFELKTDEKVFTVDGEILESSGEPFRVSIGPTLRLAIGAQTSGVARYIPGQI